MKIFYVVIIMCTLCTLSIQAPMGEESIKDESQSVRLETRLIPPGPVGALLSPLLVPLLGLLGTLAGLVLGPLGIVPSLL